LKKKMRVIISGGGTGGHVFPALAIAEALKKKAPGVNIMFVGAQGKLEMEKVPKAGYPIEGLWISGLDRKLTKRNLLFPFKLVNSLWRSRKIIKRFKPDVAIGVGGYASGPLLYQAAAMNLPTLIQEQNSYAGITNKLLAKKVTKICVAYEGMEKFFPKDKLVLTGNPVRKEIYHEPANKAEARRKLGLDPDNKTILLFGGSLGARTINDAIEMHADLLAQKTDINLIWQVGKLYYDEFSKSKLSGINRIKILPFIEDMATAYAAADLAVCRAGALTISELQMVGKPSILVPSPNVAEDHQTKNAMALVQKEAAILVKDNTARELLVPTFLELVNKENELNMLAENIKKMQQKDAAIKIAAEVFKLTE
jgi:UDP-N-acetylglucosamine--N-acetylmuramyl-(pentapeptide) pyrophosphoryl-undecaprenol N-acetylglucosamine transferase